MTTSQDWWPADYGHYGPLFIRMSWHAAGTYRIADGRGGGGQGAQRFAPLNSWPDNANLDKARRLLWPVKQKYGQKISWADLLVFAGNCALESMGFKTFGFGFGREDIWEPEEIFWGPEDTWLGDERYSGDRELSGPLGAVQMGLIYVNPEGPNGEPDPLKAARDIRETFRRMAMNDEETFALIAGGHTFGKTHGAGPADYVGPEPEGAPIEQQGLGWKSTYGTGKGADAITSGLEVTWTPTPTQVGQQLPRDPVRLRVGAHQEPGRAHGSDQAKDGAGAGTVPGPGRRRPTRVRRRCSPPTWRCASTRPTRRSRRRFLEHPDEFADGVRQGLVQAAAPRHGAGLALPRPVGAGAAAVAGPGAGGRPRADRRRTTSPRSSATLLDSGLSDRRSWSRTAWAAAASFRGTDKRGGANGARIRLEPQRDWEVNDPAELAHGAARRSSRSSRSSTPRSPAEAGLARRPDRAGRLRRGRAGGAATPATTSPSRSRRGAPTPRRSRPTSSRSPCSSRRPTGSATTCAAGEKLPPETLLLDRANLLTLTAPEMTVLVGGLRALGANVGQTPARRLHRPARAR